MKKILIIGAKGFIGSGLCSYFKERGIELWQCDVVADPDLNYYKVSEKDPDLSTIFSKNKFFACINASGSGSVAFANENPEEDHAMNVKNTERILEAIRTNDPSCRFIQFSSAAVYGNPEKLPVKESDTPAPISVYGKNKLESEKVCEKYSREFNMLTCCLRVFSVYGPGLKKQLFWDIYQRLRTQDTITLAGTGNESRDFIFITDLARAVDLVLENSHFKADVINVASGIETKISTAAALFLEKTGTKKNVFFSGTIRKGDPLNWRADISRMNSFGFKTVVDMNEGLNMYAQWLKTL